MNLSHYYKLLHPTELRILECVSNGEPMSISEISRKTKVDYRNLWRYIKIFQRVGIISEDCEIDRRNTNMLIASYVQAEAIRILMKSYDDVKIKTGEVKGLYEKN